MTAFRLLAEGQWNAGSVTVEVVASTFCSERLASSHLAPPEVAAELAPRVGHQPSFDARTKVRGYHRQTNVEAAPGDVSDAPWQREKARLGDRLFDGAMCRFESLDATADRLTLRVSRTSYRVFVNTNLFGPRDLPAAGRANPIGVSSILETVDGKLLLGRRGEGVAYYPNRVHPFAGSLEWPGDGGAIDVFAECRRELAEELRVADGEIESLRLVAVCEDVDLRHPELLLHAKATTTARALAGRLDPAEHDAVYAVEARVEAVKAALSDPRLTPVARASLVRWISCEGRAGSGVV